MIHLRSIELAPGTKKGGGFPFDAAVVKALTRLEFSAPVTFLVGENGTGKSLLLESIAAGVRLPAVGRQDPAHDPTLAPARRLADKLRFGWARRTNRGFFLRAEDFFGFIQRVTQLRSELQHDLREVQDELEGHSNYARQLAEGPFRSSLRQLEDRYGRDLDANSHGESFLRLFKARLVPGGLYLLDEPEAALAPQWQLALLVMLRDLVEQDSQFIIATHSPILMAYPGAAIISLDPPPLREVSYDSLEHVQLTRDFLNNPGRFLAHLGFSTEPGRR